MNNAKRTFVTPGSKQALESMKYEIANEFGVTLGPDTASRDNGSVGGEITKRLVQAGYNSIGGSGMLGRSNQGQSSKQSQ